jgi:hypothetical protein
MNLALEQTFDAAKAAAIEEFAHARVDEVMLKAAETRLAVIEARRQLVLRTFNVTDVAKLGDKLAKNKFAAEKLHDIFGGAYELLKDSNQRPLVDIQIVKDDPDVGEVRIYTYYGRYTRGDGKVTEQMGSFSTKAEFFAKAHGEWKGLHDIDVTDVMVAAQTETYKKCIFRGTGLGDWTEKEGEQLQAEAKGHDFKGSVTKSKGVEDLVLPFGNNKGVKITEAPTTDLEYHLKKAEESLADPKRAKFKDANTRLRDGIKAVLAARLQKVQEEQEHGVGAPQEEVKQPDGTPPTRGKLVSLAFTKLEKLTGKDQKKAAALLRMISRERWTGKEIATLSEFTDEQLTEILQIEDGVLTAALTSL